MISPVLRWFSVLRKNRADENHAGGFTPPECRELFRPAGKIRPDSQNPAASRGFFSSPETPRISPKIPIKSRNYPDWLQKKLEFPEKPGPCCSVCKPAQSRPGTPFEDVPGRIHVRFNTGSSYRPTAGAEIGKLLDSRPAGAETRMTRDPRPAVHETRSARDPQCTRPVRGILIRQHKASVKFFIKMQLSRCTGWQQGGL